MIKKFKSITNLAVFNAFEWDKSVLDCKNNILDFKQNNIIYGRNYSGKTTLSRIVRAMETGVLSDKYTSPSFCVEFDASPVITHENLKAHGKTIRVFNEDFVRENLKFIVDQNEHIESFAILGDDNNKIETEIKDLELKLGSNENGKETGLHEEFKNLLKISNDANNKHASSVSNLDSKLTSKAIDKKIGIKYQSERFGDQNYNISKLRNDISTVISKGFTPIDEKKEKELCKIIEEKPLNDLPPLSKMAFSLADYSVQAKQLLEKKVIESGKIENLLKDAVMNRWVKEGFGHHRDKYKSCGFCGNPITNERWLELNNHFDEESTKLEDSIRVLIRNINAEIKAKANSLKIDTNQFYSKFHERCKYIQIEYDEVIESYLNTLKNIENQLITRQEDLLNEKTFQNVEDNSTCILTILEKYEKLRSEVNAFSKRLTVEKSKAQDELRLKEVHKFVLTIGYLNEIENIGDLETAITKANAVLGIKRQELESVKKAIDEKKRLLNDEEKGATKVNEYLNDYFGHNFLSLRPIEKADEFTGKKQIRFEVVRDKKKAHHLSEGECSLIAFCYFMAKLHDIETNGLKPIIWIDDPISSLDGNHIFFIYSLINKDIVANKNYEQLFISTHNLDFLKYLKRLHGAPIREENKSKKFGYFLIQRQSKYSSIHPMPIFLCHYVTEFNYLFEQIHKCATITKIEDENHGCFYNFGNNARKFLEVFLYYKFPDSTSDEEKYKKFFGSDTIPSTLANRINNEYSHLCGILERGGLPIEVPEMNTTAKLILDRIKTLDEQQYNALLNSIGATIGA